MRAVYISLCLCFYQCAFGLMPMESLGYIATFTWFWTGQLPHYLWNTVIFSCFTVLIAGILQFDSCNLCSCEVYKCNARVVIEKHSFVYIILLMVRVWCHVVFGGTAFIESKCTKCIQLLQIDLKMNYETTELSILWAVRILMWYRGNIY